MKILVLNYEYPPLGGGAAPVARDICEELKKRGHDVDVITMGYKNLPAKEEKNGVTIHRVKCLRSKQFKCMPWEQFTYIMSAKSFIKKHIDMTKYDLCHTHFVIPTGAVSRWVSKKYKIPVVITAHGSDVEGHNSKKYMKIMHRVLRKSWRSIVDSSYAVISPSKFLYKLMMKAYKNEKKYIVIPNGVDLKKYQSLSSKDNKKKKILLMGRLQNFKNVQMIIDALSKVDFKGWSVDILGDGPYRPELENQVKELGLVDHVSFRGWIENSSKEQLKYLEEASIYISASRFENCPMSVIETVAAGCYPLLSDIPAHRQLIGDDEFYFELDSVDQLSNKIQERIDIGNSRFEYDVEKFDWEQIIKRYMSVFEKAVEK